MAKIILITEDTELEIKLIELLAVDGHTITNIVRSIDETYTVDVSGIDIVIAEASFNKQETEMGIPQMRLVVCLSLTMLRSCVIT